MPGRKPLRRIQFGREVTPGTAVAASARMAFNGGMIEDLTEVVYPDQLVGIYGGTDRTYIPKAGGKIAIAETPLTPEQAPWLFAAAFGGAVTGVADGTGSTGFRYTTTIPTDSASTPTNRALTVETGDDYEVERMAYGKVVKITLKGSAGGGVTMSGEMIGSSVSRFGTAFTTVALPTGLNDLVFAGSRLYLDLISGTVGTTLITSQFLGFEVTFEAMWVPKYTGEAVTGVPGWTFVVYTGSKVSGKLTLEHDPAADGSTGLKALWRAQTPRLMRIDVLGQAYGTPGTSTTFTGGRRGIRIDLPIKVTKIPPLEDMDNNDIVTVEWESRYNTTAGNAGTVLICNEVSALP